MLKIILNGTPPSKKNAKIIVCRGSRPLVLPSKNYTAWHDEQMWLLKKYKQKFQFARLVITFFSGDKRLYDLTNKAESIMDLLVDAGILADDNYSVVADLHLVYGGIAPKSPHVIIDIYEKET